METLKDFEEKTFKDGGVTPQNAKIVEEASLNIASFTNTDASPFEGMWGGKARLVKSGETIFVPRFLAEHYAKQLADKILLRGDNLGDELGRAKIYERCLTAPQQEEVSPKVETTEPEPEEFADIKEESSDKPEPKKQRRQKKA